MEKYHYDPEEYPNLNRLAGEMIPCLETEAGWQDREIKETFPGRDQSFLAVGITLGKGIDALQEKYLQNGFLTESYMIEVLSSELLLKSYRAYTECKELVGTWEGTFEGRNATLNITTANSEGLKATIHVQYTNLTNEALTGTVNTVTNTIHFDDVYKNGTLDGQYNGTFTGDGMDAFEGTYENYTTKKQVNFSFKKAKADVEN